MIIEEARRPLKLIERDTPKPGPGQVLNRVKACAVCRTDQHVGALMSAHFAGYVAGTRQALSAAGVVIGSRVHADRSPAEAHRVKRPALKRLAGAWLMRVEQFVDALNAYRSPFASS